MSETRSGETVSAQIGKMGAIDNLVNADFQLAGMNDGEFIETQFDCGWNPEIVKTVKQTSLSGTNLKWGY